MKNLILSATVMLSGFSPKAATVALTYDTLFNGKAPAGPAAWVRGSITDVAVDTVVISFEAAGLSGKEFVGDVKFNLNPAVTGVSLESFAGPVSKVTAAQRTFNDAGFRYDLSIDFPDSNSLDRFTEDETVSVTLTGKGLDASDFLFPSEKKDEEGPYSLLHIQGLVGGGSSKVTLGQRPQLSENLVTSPPAVVPETSTWLSVLGLAGVVGTAWRRRSWQAGRRGPTGS